MNQNVAAKTHSNILYIDLKRNLHFLPTAQGTPDKSNGVRSGEDIPTYLMRCWKKFQ